MSRVIVYGSSGMAGHVIARYLVEQNHEVIAVDRSQLDIEKSWQVTDFFGRGEGRADFVVNCIGLLVKDCIDRPDRAAHINSWWPRFLERHYRHTATRIIHLSTDCVFNGVSGPNEESYLPTETNAYGRSKVLGEIDNAKDVTLRMSIIGPELKNGTGLFNWIYHNPETDIPGWDNAWWNGVTTLQLAKVIHQHIARPRMTGIYHAVSNEASINKYELLCKINDVFSLGKNVIKTAGPKIVDKRLLDTRNEVKLNIDPDYTQQLIDLRDWYFNPGSTDACDASNDQIGDQQNSSDTEPTDGSTIPDPASQDLQDD